MVHGGFFIWLTKGITINNKPKLHLVLARLGLVIQLYITAILRKGLQKRGE
jgi:hypothetical protein